MVYDPDIKVIHHVAPRIDNDSLHRGRFDWQATADVAFNESYIALLYGRGAHRLAMFH
jgi:hypothetical protein